LDVGFNASFNEGITVMSSKMRGKQFHLGLNVDLPPPIVEMRLDQVLWDFAQQYRKMFAKNNPHLKLSKDQAAISMLMSFEEGGHAVRYTDPDGSIIWRASPKFLRETGLEPGTLVSIGPFTRTN
jgi:hypothetical protein